MDFIKPWLSNFTYFVDVAPVNLALDLDFVKQWLKLDPLDTSQDALLTLLIRAATECAEKITRRTFITTTFLTFRNSFRPAIELVRSRFKSLVSFKYTVNSSLVDVDNTLYYTTFEKDYSKIILKVNSQYPTNGDDILQGIQIKFVAGYGDDPADIPADLQVAILNHLTMFYENRGDCDLASAEESLPNTSRANYNKNRIIRMAK